MDITSPEAAGRLLLLGGSAVTISALLALLGYLALPQAARHVLPLYIFQQ